jgi:hypothetical protein
MGSNGRSRPARRSSSPFPCADSGSSCAYRSLEAFLKGKVRSVATVAQLRKRWSTVEGRKLASAVGELIREEAPRMALAAAVAGLPCAEEVPGMVDLRGIPYAGAVPVADCQRIDMSFATRPPGSENHEISLSVCDYRYSRFEGIRFGVSVLAGKVSGCSFAGSRLRQTDWSFSGDIIDASLRRADLSWGRFASQRLERCSFEAAILHNVGIARVTFQDCDFRGAQLRDVMFDGCQFEGVNRFDDAVLTDVKGLPEAVLERAGSKEAEPDLVAVTQLSIAGRILADRGSSGLVVEVVAEMLRLARRLEAASPALEGLECGLNDQERAYLEEVLSEATDRLMAGES